MNTAPYIFILAPDREPRSARLNALVSAMQRNHQMALLRDEPDWVALGSSDAAGIDLADGGMVWGHLFATGSARSIVEQSASDPLSEQAEDFVRNYWGGYLAIRRQRGGFEVLRDPSGDIPCYICQIDGTQVLTSRPHLLFDAGLLPIEMDWTIIAQALAYRDLKPARTGLRGMSEILPGVAARLLADRVETRCVWTPWSFAGADKEITDFSAAAAAVRKVTSQCIAAWSSHYRQPIVEISGGLDSAIVAAGLVLAGQSPASLNFWPAEGDPDERPYARAIAERLGLHLTEVPLDIAAVDLTVSHAGQLPAPARGPSPRRWTGRRATGVRRSAQTRSSAAPVVTACFAMSIPRSRSSIDICVKAWAKTCGTRSRMSRILRRRRCGRCPGAQRDGSHAGANNSLRRARIASSLRLLRTRYRGRPTIRGSRSRAGYCRASAATSPH